MTENESQNEARNFFLLRRHQIEMLSPIRSHPCEESKSCGDAASPRSGLSEGKESGFETANFEPNETEAHLIMEEEIEQMR